MGNALKVVDRRIDDRSFDVPIIGGGRARAEVTDSGIKFKPPSVRVMQKSPTSAASFRYEHPDLDDDPQPDPHLSFDLSLAGDIAEMKEREFPGHPFEIWVEHEQGVVLISLPALMGPINRYIVHVKDLYGDAKLKAVRDGMGEILERYQIPRSGYTRDDMAAAVAQKPIIFRRHQEVPV